MKAKAAASAALKSKNEAKLKAKLAELRNTVEIVSVKVLSGKGLKDLETMSTSDPYVKAIQLTLITMA